MKELKFILKLSTHLKKAFVCTLINCFCILTGMSQEVVNELPQESYDNMVNLYNYTYWDESYANSDISDYRFCNQTEKYKLSINYTGLSIYSLNLTESALTPSEALEQKDADIFSDPESGDIYYAVLQDGAALYEKSDAPTNMTGVKTHTQLPEFGKWCNRRMVDSVNFTNDADMYGRFTGIEFTNWHKRFKITFHFRPRATITNGQLKLAVEMPSEFNEKYNNELMYGFADNSDKGFSVKPGSTVGTASISSNTLTVLTDASELIAGTSYAISLIFYVVEDNLATTYTTADDSEAEVTISTAQTLPNQTATVSVEYNEDEGVHFISVPRYSMGYNDCATAEDLQNIEIGVENTSDIEKTVRLCFQQKPGTNIVGFSSMIRTVDGIPTGQHLQISKNWHGSSSLQLHGGSQISEYTEIIIPANTTVNFAYTRVGAKWGETYGAFSHQLSLVGYGDNSGYQWLEAGLGSFGENICHSPDYFANTNVTDWRPFLVTSENYGGTSTECGWTGNVGGIDLSVYFDESGSRDYQSEVKTKFHKYGPNLTQTSVAFYSSDKKIRTQYTFFLNRSDDIMRTYYKVKIEAIEDVSFERYDFFQLGGDTYRMFYAKSVAYGNDEGMLGEFTAGNTSSVNDYTTDEIALTGENPWVWAGDGERTDQSSYGTIEMDVNNGFVIRDYRASFNGTEYNTPYMRERSTTRSDRYPTSYCLVTPSDINSFSAGDVVEFTVEALILPKQADDYYGPNQNFIDALTVYGNSWEMLHREAYNNRIEATSINNTVESTYPITVETTNNTADVTITGGLGYVPIVFSGLTDISNPVLWKSTKDCWEQVDQSNWGNDFWQTEYDEETGLFELIFNVNQDLEDDEEAKITYYLGQTSPSTVITPQSNVNKEGWSSSTSLSVEEGVSVMLAPQVNINGDAGVGQNSSWIWTGSNGFSQTGRVVSFTEMTSTDQGVYTVAYDDGMYCVDDQSFILCLEDETFTVVPQSNLNSAGWSMETDILGEVGDQVAFAPAAKQFGSISNNTGSWEWTGPNGFTSSVRVVYIDIESESVGDYLVTFTKDCGLSASETFSTSITELTENNVNSYAVPEGSSLIGTDGFEMYPNPASNKLDLYFSNEIMDEVTEVSISDMLGKEIKRFELAQGAREMHIDVEGLTSGMYLLILKQENRALTTKKLLIDKE